MTQASSKDTIDFLLNDKPVRLDGLNPRTTVLDFLRLEKNLCGTKEGCNEGDCGACTVLIGRLTPDNTLRYITVNSCIIFLPALDGCHLVTVEHLRDKNGGLHPVQQAFVNHHASQCGFCTPGFVMSIYALWMENPAPSMADIDTALQGNLCRCTGYSPIRKAALSLDKYKETDDPLFMERESVLKTLTDMKAQFKTTKTITNPDNAKDLAILPVTVDGLAGALQTHPNATIIAGATDVGLWVTKHINAITPMIFTAHLTDLQRITHNKFGRIIGAGCSYTDALPHLIADYPHLHDLFYRIGGVQVRNNGTLGGNIANGSPIGDTPPPLIALGARLGLRLGAAKRDIALEDFFIDYGKQDLRKGEFIETIHIPAPDLPKGVRVYHAAYKISKRRDEDISTLSVAFYIAVENGLITTARIAFGGMAAIPKRAGLAESALIGREFDLASFKTAGETLAEDFQPLSDVRGSAEYRMSVAKNMFVRFYLEMTENSGGGCQ